MKRRKDVIRVLLALPLAVATIVCATAWALRDLPAAGGLFGVGLLILTLVPILIWRRGRGNGHSARHAHPAGEGKERRGLRLGVAAVVVCGIAATIVAVRQQNSAVRAGASARFERLTERATGEIQRRVNQTVYGLKGARGIYVASDRVERREFERFVESRDLPREFPGALGFGMIERVERKNLPAFIEAERADGAPDFTVHSDPAHKDEDKGDYLYVVKSVFPREANQAVWGLDMGSEPVRRAGVEKAVRSGEPTITGRVRLVQDQGQRSGFIYMLPVYAGFSTPGSVQEREEKLVALTYAPILLDEALADLEQATEGQLDVEVFDGDTTEAAGRLFDLDGHLRGRNEGGSTRETYAGRMFVSQTPIGVGGRTWTVVTSTTGVFDAGVHAAAAWLIAIGGVAMTLLMALALYLLGSSRARAVALAKSMTEELRSTIVESDRLAEIARRTGNGVIVADHRGRIEWVNEGFIRLTGYTLEEVRGRTPGSVLQGPETDRAEVKRLREAMREGRLIRGELVNYRKDGSPYIVEVEIGAIRDREGRVTGFMGIDNDVTEKRRGEAALASNAAMLREMGQVAGVGGWELDLRTMKARCTEQTLAIHELPLDHELKLEEGLSYYAPEARHLIADAIAEGGRSGKPWDMEVPFITATGRRIWVRAVGRAEWKDGKVIRLHGALQDITSQREVREQLSAAIEAAHGASMAKSSFLANMSHEIRTPLTAILGFADILKEEEGIDRAPRQRVQAIESIRAAGSHLLSIINDILDLSKIEADRMTVEKVETGLPRLITEVAGMMRPRAAGKGVELSTRLDTPIPDRILGDPTRMRQILTNMVGNAAKFTEAGSVRIVAGVVGASSNQRLVIDVTDTGPGLSVDQVERLFQPFSQADETVTRKYGGTGLGLTICRRLAVLMGGEVTLVWSQPGRGSCFRLNLPLEAAPGAVMVSSLDMPVEAGATTVADQPLKLTGRILVAEDGVDNQRLIAFHLKKAGATVEIADNGRIALDMIEATAGGVPYDLLLTDMQMPEMDGYTLARTLRERGSRLAVIALTAHAMVEDERRCREAGCDDYATKPIDRTRLLATCAKWLGRTGGDGRSASGSSAAGEESETRLPAAASE